MTKESAKKESIFDRAIRIKTKVSIYVYVRNVHDTLRSQTRVFVPPAREIKWLVCDRVTNRLWKVLQMTVTSKAMFRSRAQKPRPMHALLVSRRYQVRGSAQASFFCIDGSWNIFYGHSLPSGDSRREVVSYLWKNVHWVLVNHLIGLSLVRKIVVR